MEDRRLREEVKGEKRDEGKKESNQKFQIRKKSENQKERIRSRKGGRKI